MRELSVGDVVRWGSQAGGYGKIKEGRVLVVLQPRESPSRFANQHPHRGWNRFFAGRPGQVRDHVSYVVDVNGRLYWPLVHKLELVGSVVE